MEGSRISASVGHVEYVHQLARGTPGLSVPQYQVSGGPPQRRGQSWQAGGWRREFIDPNLQVEAQAPELQAAWQALADVKRLSFMNKLLAKLIVCSAMHSCRSRPVAPAEKCVSSVTSHGNDGFVDVAYARLRARTCTMAMAASALVATSIRPTALARSTVSSLASWPTRSHVHARNHAHHTYARHAAGTDASAPTRTAPAHWTISMPPAR